MRKVTSAFACLLAVSGFALGCGSEDIDEGQNDGGRLDADAAAGTLDGAGLDALTPSIPAEFVGTWFAEDAYIMGSEAPWVRAYGEVKCAAVESSSVFGALVIDGTGGYYGWTVVDYEDRWDGVLEHLPDGTGWNLRVASCEVTCYDVQWMGSMQLLPDGRLQVIRRSMGRIDRDGADCAECTACDLGPDTDVFEDALIQTIYRHSPDEPTSALWRGDLQ